MDSDCWRELFSGMAARWSSFAPARVELSSEQFREDFTRVRADYLRLVEQGKWNSGPRDLMTVLGATDDELSHSRVVAWLLQPTGRHGLGFSVLHRILQTGWPQLPMPDLATAVVAREVPRPPDTGVTRADVVVWVGPTVLVIENKVWAPESSGQCQALFREWIDEAADVRFLLLSRDGHPPLTAISDDARSAWRAISYRHLAGLLQELTHRSVSADTAQRAVGQYQAALRHLVGAQDAFAITVRDKR